MTDLERIERDIKHYEEQGEMAETLISLEKNKFYKKLFTEAYLKEYALGMLTFKGSMQAQEPKVQAHADYQLAGVAGLQQFLSNVRQTGIAAQEKVDYAKQERELLLAQGV